MESTRVLFILYILAHATMAQPLDSTEGWNTGQQAGCDTQEASDICTACSQLPPMVQVPAEACCTSIRALKFCDACLSDIESCLNVVKELDELTEFGNENEPFNDNKNQASVGNYDLPDEKPLDGIKEVLDIDDDDDDDDDDDTRVKRFGRLFMKTPKRYGRLIFGKRDSDLEKRYGSLFINKSRWFGKRNGGSYSDVQKRYGPLFINRSRNGWFGKRSGVDDGRDYGESSSFNKRYGPLFIGKGRYFGKRSNLVVDKRFGRLFMGGRRSSWFG